MESTHCGSGSGKLHSLRSLALAFVAAGAVGWLGGGSCQASYCSEDCDPCLKQCRCNTSICYQTSATFQATHALTDYTLDELPADPTPVDASRTMAPTTASAADPVGQFAIESAGVLARESPTKAPPRRTFRDIVGLSVQRAGGSPWPGADECVQFARGVLAVNAALFPRTSTDDFVLDAALPCDGQWVVQFHRGAQELHRDALDRRADGGVRTSTRELEVVSFLFDARGNLIEIDHAAGS